MINSCGTSHACSLRERSRFLHLFALLVGTSNAQPLGCFGPKHISAKGHPTGSSLLQKLRAGRAVEDPDNLIRYAPRASSGSVHSLPLMIKEPESLKARTPTTGGAKCRLARIGGGIIADAGPLLSLSLTSCRRNIVNCAQNLS